MRNYSRRDVLRLLGVATFALATGVDPMRIVRASPLPPSLGGNRVVLLGDSLTAPNDGYEFSTGSPTARGYFNWARGYLGDSLRLAAELGVGGERTDQILARVDAAVAVPADLAIVCAGANDIGQGVSAPVISENIDAIVAAFRGAGRHVVLTTIPPTESADTSEKRSALLTANEHIRALDNPASGVSVADIYAVLADGAPNVLLEGVAFDVVHWTGVGAARVGRVVADAIAPLWPVQVTEWGADSACGNPTFADNAAGWTVSGGILSVEPSSEHAGNIAVVTYDGDTGSDTRLWWQENVAAGLFAPGDKIVVKADVEWDIVALQAARQQAEPNIALQARQSDAAGGVITATATALQMESSFRRATTHAPLQGRGIWRTRPLTVAADIDRLYMRCGFAGVETGVVKCHRFAAYKVP